MTKPKLVIVKIYFEKGVNDDLKKARTSLAEALQDTELQLMVITKTQKTVAFRHDSEYSEMAIEVPHGTENVMAYVEGVVEGALGNAFSRLEIIDDQKEVEEICRERFSQKAG